MSDNLVRRTFFQLCQVADDSYMEDKDKSFESTLLDILIFSKSQETDADVIERCFIELVHESKYPWEILQFCMRELKLKSVYKEMEFMVSKMSRVQQMDTPLRHVFAVYEDPWEDQDMYDYYNNS